MDAKQELSREWLLEFASSRFGIDVAELDQIANEAEASGVSFHSCAMDRGVLDSVQASIVQTLRHPDNIHEDFSFVDLLGRGAMGVVYRAKQKSLNREVAVKTILPGTSTLTNRFRTEANTIAKLRHPNIVSAFEFFEKDHRFYLVLEYLDGVTLADQLEKDGPMSEHVTWHIILQIVSGLYYAQQHNVVHRDIKPQNLFLLDCPPGYNLPTGVPLLKLTDFGLASSIDRCDETGITLEGKVVGTPVYMAPEQAQDSHVDHRADIYSIGATAYHMLSGSALYDGRSIMRLLLEKQSIPAPRLDQAQDGVSEASGLLIHDMMQINPDDRPSDYAVIIDRIKQILEPESHRLANAKETRALESREQELDSTPPEPQEKTKRRPRFTVPLLIAAAIVTVICAGLLFTSPAKPYPTKMKYSNLAMPLFEPPNVAGWTALGGSLDSVLDGEGSDVLEAAGAIEHALPEYQYFSFSAGVNLLKANAIRFQLLGDDKMKIIDVDVSRTQIVTTNSSSRTSKHPLSLDPWRSATVEEPKYCSVVITTEPGRIFVEFNGNTIAEIARLPNEAAKLLRIETDAMSHLESLLVAEMLPAEV